MFGIIRHKGELYFLMRTYRPETIDTQTLKRSYWLLGHLRQFKRNATVGIIVVEGVIILLALIQFGGYLYYAIVRQDTIIQPLRASAKYAGSRITIPDPTVLVYGAVPHGSDQYDLYARIINQNEGWRADFDFIYSVNGVEQPPQKVFLLPKEEKYILKLGIAAQQEQPTISYRIANLGWHRLSSEDSKAIINRSKFEVTEIQLIPGQDTQSIQGGARLTFTLENHSVYKFWDFRVPVVLKQGADIVAVALVPVFSLERDEKKRLEVQWGYPITVTSFEIIPDIDILNPAALRISL